MRGQVGVSTDAQRRCWSEQCNRLPRQHRLFRQQWRHDVAYPKRRSGCWRSSSEPPPRRQLTRIRDTHPAKSNGAVHVTATDGALDRPIIVIDQRMLARDCLVKCLGDAIAGRKILAFASAAEWFGLWPARTSKPGVILICAARYRRAEHRDDDFRVPAPQATCRASSCRIPKTAMRRFARLRTALRVSCRPASRSMSQFRRCGSSKPGARSFPQGC